MDLESVKLFMDVRKSGNLTKTAKHYYITQSTVSKRLALLEDELGVTLFQRQKGKSQVLLTPEGEMFCEIANRMLLLQEQAFKIHQSGIKYFFTIACINSAQDYTMPPLILKFQQKNPNLLLMLENHHSVEIFPLVENQSVDVGITQVPAPYPDLQSLLLYEEEYRVVMRKPKDSLPPGAQIHPTALKPEHEIYQSFCEELKDWHDHWWSAFRSKIRVNTTATGEMYFSAPEDWMIVPACIAAEMSRRGFTAYSFDVEMPKHKVYLVWKKRTDNAFVEAFVEDAKLYFR